MTLKHCIITDPSLAGWEYGMLRHLEDEIQRQTGAQLIDRPEFFLRESWMARLGLGMRGEKYRKFLPKPTFAPEADVMWRVLMGPENYSLDLFHGWEKSAKLKILYLFDTLPHQFDLIARLLAATDWDICITSFIDAVPHLERITRRKWHCVEQGVFLPAFEPPPPAERNIHFSAYGRRQPAAHGAVSEFCARNNLYYDYTTHDGKHPVVDPRELYRQYIWHLAHSAFTFSWPLEMTNQSRAGVLRPITCRWFEAAAAATPIIGQAPANASFNEVLHPELVIPLKINDSRDEIFRALGRLWEQRDGHLAKAAQVREAIKNKLGWSQRVAVMLDLAERQWKTAKSGRTVITGIVGKEPSPDSMPAAATLRPSPEASANKTQGSGPLVSVIIPCYNAERWIGEAIESCFRQNYSPMEVIVIDDGSTDGSLEKIKSYGNRVRWESGPNRGGNHARNRGIVLARGSHIQFLDADDYLLPGKIARQVDALEISGADVVYGDWRHQHHQPKGNSFFEPVTESGAHDDVLGALLSGWWVAPAALLFRRSAVEKAGGWDESLSAAQDRDFFISVAMTGAKIQYQPGCDSIYRRYGNVTVSTGNPQRWLENHRRVLDKAVARLEGSGRLSEEYRHDLALSYFELARNYYDLDASKYDEIIERLHVLDPNFQPHESLPYRLVQRAMGFRSAEKLASWKRRLASKD